MARLVNVWRDDDLVKLRSRQMPLVVEENLKMIMDVNGLRAISDSPLICGKQLAEFIRQLNTLTKEEVKQSFRVTCKDMLKILGETVPCVGCRRSVERLFFDLMKSGHPALDPLVITPDGLLTIKDDVLKSPQQLCTILHGHSARLSNLVENQPRNRKSRRCVLHSLEIQRMRPPPNAWREVWDCMDLPCRQELALIETDTLDETLDTYLRKHRFCAECRNKVLLASSLLTKESEPVKEKGYVSSLYDGIKRCIIDHHVHLPIVTEYIGKLISRAQPELMGRERHAKTLQIAQEEVLTCLGICIADRLHRVHRRLREEETVCKVLAAVAIDALSRNFQVAVEKKRGISQLELLYEEFTREEIAKQQKREKLRLKRKKKKERRYEAEEKENTYDCSNKRQTEDNKSTCVCDRSKSMPQNVNWHKILDSKHKDALTHKCPNCSKKMKTCSISQSSSEADLALSVKKLPITQKVTVKKGSSEAKATFSIGKSKQANVSRKQLSEENSSNISEYYKDFAEKPDKTQWHYVGDCKNVTKKFLNAWMTKPTAKRKFAMWVEMKKLNSSLSEKEGRSCSEQSSQDCGYSSEYNISSSSLPSTPDGSEVACNEECCNHEEDCHDMRLCDKLHSSSSISLLRKQGGGLTLTQMLENSCSYNDNDDDDDEESYIPAEEVLEFKSRMCQVTEKRQELRQTLKERFAILCSHQNPFNILH